MNAAIPEMVYLPMPCEGIDGTRVGGSEGVVLDVVDAMADERGSGLIVRWARQDVPIDRDVLEDAGAVALDPDPILVEWARYQFVSHTPAPEDDRGLSCDERDCGWCNGDPDEARSMAVEIELGLHYAPTPDEDDLIEAAARLFLADQHRVTVETIEDADVQDFFEKMNEHRLDVRLQPRRTKKGSRS